MVTLKPYVQIDTEEYPGKPVEASNPYYGEMADFDRKWMGRVFRWNDEIVKVLSDTVVSGLYRRTLHVVTEQCGQFTAHT